MTKSAERRRKKGRMPAKLRRLFGAVKLISLFSGITAAAFVLVLAGEFASAAATLKFDSALITGADRSVILLDSSGNEIASASGSEQRFTVKLRDLPDRVKYAFISAEDARFYKHCGVDIVRVFGAAWADLRAMRLKEGASTIGQQLIKLSHLSGEKTAERKVGEAYLTLAMERRFTKDEILEMYLNFVYFGGGFYGVETAALGYFGVHARELTAAQAAQLAGILKAPSLYAPHLDMERSLKRRSTVLSLMEKYGYLTEAERIEADAEPCVLKNGIPGGDSCFIRYALDEAAAALGMDKNALISSGVRIHTTLDSSVERITNAIMERSDLFPCENAQGALVLVERGGAIRAMNGSRRRGGGETDRLDRASAMERQPGSLIKPVICYAPAIDRGIITAAAVLTDEKKDFGGYSPREAGGEYRGKGTVREALARSLNVPAVEVLAKLGAENGAAFAKKLGISFENEHIGLPLALGGFTYGVSPLEMAGAYAAFAAGGEYYKPYSVERVELDGQVLYEHADAGERVMKSGTAFIIGDMLRSAAAFGTASALSELALPIAAKTGTNLDENGGVRDVWTAAFSGEYTAVCWMGTDSAALGALPAGSTGGNSACLAIKALFSALPREKTSAMPAVPEDVISSRLDRGALFEKNEYLLATGYTPEDETLEEYFLIGTEPREISAFWLPPEPPREVLLTFNGRGRPVIRFTAGDERLVYRLYRSGDGGERLIAELTAGDGEKGYVDHTALNGGIYTYTLRAVNPMIVIGGEAAESGPSRAMRAFIPY